MRNFKLSISLTAAPLGIFANRKTLFYPCFLFPLNLR